MRIHTRWLAMLALTITTLAPGTTFAVDCDPPIAEPWDWEVTPYGGWISSPRDECGGHGPLTDPPTEEYFGDDWPSLLVASLYAFTLDLSQAVIPEGEALAVFQIRAPEPKPVVSLEVQTVGGVEQLRLFYRDNSGQFQLASGGVAPKEDGVVAVT